jgi:hypothetical protein
MTDLRRHLRTLDELDPPDLRSDILSHGPSEPTPAPPRSRRWVGAAIAAGLVVALFAWAVVGLHHGFGSGTPPAGASGPAMVLQVRAVGSIVPPSSPAYRQTTVTCRPGEPCTSEELLHAPHVVLVDDAGVKYRLGPVVVTGADIATAHALPPTAEIPFWIVTFHLTPSATTRFAEVTERQAEVLPPRQIATIVDGRVVSAPTVQAPITSGDVQVDNLTEAEAKSLVARLR